MTKHQKSILRLLSPLLLVSALLVQAIFPIFASAAPQQITIRSLQLIAGATDGGSKPGGVVNHKFTFTLNSASSVGSIKFEYCTTAADTGAATCTTPGGLDTTSATLSSQTGETGFTANGTTTATQGAPYITRSASTVTNPTVVSYQLNGITNPTNVNGETFFVRISTYTSIDATGTSLDAGTVAAATTRGIDLAGTMPESLVFCAGATVGTTSTVPDCSTVTTGAVEFNQLFSPTDTATASSQMAASTNAGTGYVITVNGQTLYSGGTPIAGMATGTSTHGVAQFGMNLKLNTVTTSTVPVGAEVAAASNGTNYFGQPLTGYDTVDTFTFNSGDAVADSASSGSDAQIFTVSYIVNVPGSQPAGQYTTTLTYICTPTF